MSDKNVKIEINHQDKALLDTLIKLLARVKVELQGAEIIAAAESMKWLSRLQKRIEDEEKAPEIKVVESEPIKSEPKKVLKKDKER